MAAAMYVGLGGIILSTDLPHPWPVCFPSSQQSHIMDLVGLIFKHYPRGPQAELLASEYIQSARKSYLIARVPDGSTMFVSAHFVPDQRPAYKLAIHIAGAGTAATEAGSNATVNRNSVQSKATTDTTIAVDMGIEVEIDLDGDLDQNTARMHEAAARSNGACYPLCYLEKGKHADKVNMTTDINKDIEVSIDLDDNLIRRLSARKKRQHRRRFAA